jgi:hypothetical protein
VETQNTLLLTAREVNIVLNNPYLRAYSASSSTLAVLVSLLPLALALLLLLVCNQDGIALG